MVVSPQHPLAIHGAPIPTTVLAEYLQLVHTDRSDLPPGREFAHLSPRTWLLAHLGAKLAFLRAGFRVWLHAPARGRGGPGKRRARSDLGRGHTARGPRHSHVGHLPDRRPPGASGALVHRPPQARGRPAAGTQGLPFCGRDRRGCSEEHRGLPAPPRARRTIEGDEE